MPRSTRKRQSRLSFTPLPSSSPAAKGYNKQIQDRAAAVTLRGSSRKRKHNGENGVNDSMPTPEATHGDQGSDLSESADEDDLDVAPSRKRRKVPRQQRIDFSNSRDAASFDSPVKLRSSAKSQPSSGVFNSSQKRRTTVISSDDDDDDDSENELPSPANIKVKNGKGKGTGSSGRSTRRTEADHSSVGQSDSEEDNVDSAPRQLPLPVEEDDEDDEMPSTMATQRRKRRPKRQASPDSFISSSPPPGPIDSDDDLEIIEPPAKRRTIRRDRRKLTKEEKEDLADDLDFLGPSSDVDAEIRKPRDTQSTQKVARQSALEKLKRQRSSQASKPHPKAVEDIDGEESDREASPDMDSDGAGSVEESEVEEVQAPMTSRQYFTANQEDDDFVESEGEGGDGVLGYPDANMPIQYTQYARMKPKELFPYAVEWMIQKKINPAFAMDDELYDLTFRKLDDEVQGLAGSKFRSAAWTEEFTYALRARPEIAYDELERDGEHYLNDHCGACNRSGHPATYRVQFQGKPYYKETLEEVNNDVNDEDGSDSDSNGSTAGDPSGDKPSWDADGRPIVPESKIYYLGRFCMGNATTAHALQHWKHHLNEWVVTWMTGKGYLNPAEIVKRDGWSEKKRRRAANKISDRMEQEGVVSKLWRDFRGNIDTARDSKQGRY